MDQTHVTNAAKMHVKNCTLHEKYSFISKWVLMLAINSTVGKSSAGCNELHCKCWCLLRLALRTLVLNTNTGSYVLDVNSNSENAVTGFEWR